MTNSSDAFKDFVCGFSVDDHFLQEPITLPNCGHNVCRSCIPKSESKRCNCGVIVERDITNDKDIDAY